MKLQLIFFFFVISTIFIILFVKAWPAGCSLVCVGGDRFNTIDDITVASASSGEEVHISVKMVAPELPGNYQLVLLCLNER